MSEEIKLNPIQLTTALRACIKARRRCLVKGAPGVGKTDIVKRLAADEKAKLIIMHPSVSDPTDYKGLPFVVDGKASFLPFGDLDEVLNATELTILFLDDLGQGSTAVQASVMQLADRIKGNKNVVLLAATNERGHRAGVQGLLEPVKSRFDTILSLGVDFPSWKAWAVENNIDYRALGYLEQQPDALHKFDATADIVNQPCPRTWEAASAILQMEVDDEDVRFAMLIGAIGAAAATTFHAWLRIAEDAPSREEVIADPHNVRIPNESSALYAVVSSLSLGFTKPEFPSIATFAQRLYKGEHGEFCALMLKDIFRKDPSVEKTPAFSALSKTPVAKLVMEAVRFNQSEAK